MKIHFFTPVAPDKDLGKAYNECMDMIPEGDWACIRDCDTMFLTPMNDVLTHMNRYIWAHSDTGMFTCLTNRIWGGCPDQLLIKRLSLDPDIRHHIKWAHEQIEKSINAPIASHDCSGFLMLIRKDAWRETGKFKEGGKFLGVDHDFCQRMKWQIRVMQTIYVFHIYRLSTNEADVSHLS